MIIEINLRGLAAAKKARAQGRKKKGKGPKAQMVIKIDNN